MPHSISDSLRIATIASAPNVVNWIGFLALTVIPLLTDSRLRYCWPALTAQMNDEWRITMDVFEAIGTQRAMRRLKDDPVSDEDIWKILDAAIKAPSGGNQQPWNFIVVRDAEVKRKIGEHYLDAWNKTYGAVQSEEGQDDPRETSAYRSAEHLAHHLADAPVLIIATIRTGGADRAGPMAGGSIYPAVQNLMLAARALGLGTTLTSLHKLHEQEVKELLGIPEQVETMALIPVGWPKGRFGAPERMPVEKVVYWEQWGDRREQ
jgi:nitroreductase